MLNLNNILLDGLIFSAVGSIYLVLLLVYNPRLLMSEGDYPDDVLAAAPPRTKEETRLAAILSTPWFLWSLGFPLYSTVGYLQQAGADVSFGWAFAHAFLILLSFWLVDLVVLDWLMFCTITPKFLVIPGTEGFPGYKDFSMHLRGHFGKGLIILAVSGLAIAAAAWWIELAHLV
jgi:hypothetical protein